MDIRSRIRAIDWPLVAGAALFALLVLSWMFDLLVNGPFPEYRIGVPLY